MKKNNVITVVVGFIETNCYIVPSEADNCVYIIDPGGDFDKIMKAVKELNCDLKNYRILLTHGHVDHISTINEFMDKLPVSLLYLHKDDHFLYMSSENALPPWIPALKNPPVPSGDISGCEFTMIHTPGHTRGGVCFYFKRIPALFSGDTIFRHSVGRTDLPGGDKNSLVESINKKIFTLPKNLTIFPGHGPSTTVGEEKKANPFLN